MANEKTGRVLDKDFEDGITHGASEFQKGAQDNIDKAQKYWYQKNDECEALIREHPKAVVLGAFVGGMIIGKLCSKGNR